MYKRHRSEEQCRKQLQPWSSLTQQLTSISKPLMPIALLSSLLQPDTSNTGRWRVRARVLATVPSLTPIAAGSEETKEGEHLDQTSPGARATSLGVEDVVKFRCRACNSAWQRCGADVAIADVCSNAACKKSSELSYAYFLRLLLHDSSAALPVLLCGKEAVRL
jgi:hypothetical protein